MSANNSKRITLGLLFIAIGVIFLLRIGNLLPFTLPVVFLSWQMILIVLGIIFLLTENNKSTGLILLTIGSVFMASSHFGIGIWQIIRLAFPAFLVVAGVLLLLPGRRYFSGRQRYRHTEENIKDRIEEVNVFSGGSKVINSDNFMGGEITCIFGGSELNFRQAKLAPGNNILEITCIFGGVTLYVPEDWTVKLDAAAVFGGFSDSRVNSNIRMVTDPEKVLVVKGVVIFGGGEIKLV